MNIFTPRTWVETQQCALALVIISSSSLIKGRERCLVGRSSEEKKTGLETCAAVIVQQHADYSSTPPTTSTTTGPPAGDDDGFYRGFCEKPLHFHHVLSFPTTPLPRGTDDSSVSVVCSFHGGLISPAVPRGR